MQRRNALSPEYSKDNKFITGQNKATKRENIMIIYYQEMSEMLDIVEGLLRKGLTFEVHTMSCKIVLTGGY